ncbi:glycoside hydrolase family 25 protein [Paraburkholderia sp. BCC1876]|jgi:Lyzozyme M1 (1,4-beta-N-acetylmuramidase)|uniref:glycoside hydrolase family 25 protein n=1 Tax=Paraburkholderia sp. BCC1876 TaxID=2676303 RepID=UPI00159065E8|nr:glycoside hydrolase family 25 protein [Paraburkholderia sp. BCC1876]
MYANVVIDISHYEGHVDFSAATKEPVIAVISKASYGLSGVDNTYAVRRDTAKACGLLWGSYHFGTGEGTGQQQAENFLEVIGQQGTDDLIALDFEPNVDSKGNPLGATMTLDQARGFVLTIYDAVGRYPLLYSNHFLSAQLVGKSDAVLSNCPLWFAEYMLSPTGKPSVPVGWNSWTLWQYTDGEVGQLPHTVLGVGPCDRNYYIDSVDALKQKWPLS